MGDAEVAKTAIDKAIEIRKSRRSSELFWRSVILEKFGNKDQAVADWKETEAYLAANSADDPLVLAIDQQSAGE